jgi:predicted outer membrane protein
MRKNKVLQALLAVSAVAALSSAFGVQAQSTGSGSQSASERSATSTSQGKSDQTNPTTSGGAMGKDQTGGSSSGTSGMSGSTGTSGSGAAASGGAATGGAAPAAPGTTGGTLSKGDQQILAGMAQANIAEIEAGKMAQSKSQNDQVKSFAQQMIDDHTKALSDVQSLAQSKGVTLPTEPDAKHKALAAKLDKMSGDTFDKTYMSQAGLADHKKVHAMLTKDAKRAKDPDVQALAAKMAPVVEQHLKAAEQMKTPKSGTTAGK